MPPAAGTTAMGGLRVMIMLSCPRLGLRMPGGLDDVRDAYRELELRHTLGEIVLMP